MNKFVEKIASVLAVLLLLFALLVSVAEFFCAQNFWFEFEFSRHNNENEIVEEYGTKEAVFITNEMMHYLLGSNSTNDYDHDYDYDFNCDYDYLRTIRVSDSDKAFFNSREIHHLEDCKILFITAKRLRTIAVILAVVILVLLFTYSTYINKRNKRVATVSHNSSIFTSLAHSYIATTRIAVLITGLVVACFAVFFDKAYDWLHELLFDNYLWILNPATDNLIKLMSTDIICETAGIILIVWATIALFITCVLKLILRRKMTG